MERFAGITPGLMLVLGADIPPQELEKLLGESDQDTVEEFAEVSRMEYGDAVFWLDSRGITLKKMLGEGSYGTAFQVDSEEHGKDITMKVTRHDNEQDCVAWLYEHPEITQKKDSPLPEIFEMGAAGNLFYYLRPMYEMSDSDCDYAKMIWNVFKATDGEFYPWDMAERNVGTKENGQPVYFDPACTLDSGADSRFLQWIWSELQQAYNKGHFETKTGVPFEELESWAKKVKFNNPYFNRLLEGIWKEMEILEEKGAVKK